MTVPNAVITPQVVFNAQVLTTAANTNFSDAPPTTVLLLTASVLTRLTRLQATQRANVSTATMLQLYLSKDAGVTKRLINTRLCPVASLSSVGAGPLLDFGYSDAAPLILPPGDQLYAAQSVAITNGFSWLLEWGEF